MNKGLIDEKLILFEFSEDFDIFCELVNDYKVGHLKMLADIEVAIMHKDHEKMRMVAHTLKGVSGNFYCKPLTQVASSLEKFGEDRTFTGATAAFIELKAYNDKVLAELDEFIKKNASLLGGEVA